MSNTALFDQLADLQLERDIADAIIAQLDRQAVEDTQAIALLTAKLRARDKLISRLSDRIKALEEALYEDEDDDLASPPPELAEAFANFVLPLD